MISDGDSSAYEAIKHTYVDILLENLARSESFDNCSSMDTIDQDTNLHDNSSLSQLSPEQYEDNLVIKEDCINHIKKRVSSHLKTLKCRYTGFENVREENVASATKKKKHIEVKKHIPSSSNAHSSSDDDNDDIRLSMQPVSKSRRRRRLDDGKPYGGGIGRMTKAMEHNLAECYGLAIRQSSESAKGMMIIPQTHILDFIVDLDEDDAVTLMERNCRAAFLHNIKQSDREVQHALCPVGPDSWCSYHHDKYVSSKQKIDSVKDVKRLDSVSANPIFPYNFKV